MKKEEEKIKFYSPICEESGVVMAFTKLHEQLGFPKIVSSSARGFDIDDIEYIDNLGKHRVTIEFEYLSSNFILHGHQKLMDDMHKYIVICWEDDCNLARTLADKYEKYLYNIIELKDFIEIVPDDKNIDIIDPNYYLINYNRKNAEYRPIAAWANSNTYRFNNNNNIKIKNASKALIKQGDYIVGGFDIIRFNNIKISDNDDLISLYKSLTDYPVSLFTMSINEIKNEYVNNNIGHIFYDNFYELDNINLRKTIKEILPDLNISNGAIQTLTEEQYNLLIGKR